MPCAAASLGFPPPRGDIRTPAFMPVGTAGTVKALYMDQVKGAGADIILGNTYHLMLRLGGLHEFSGWPGTMLTDSGGFQVWSLAQPRKMDADGVTFQSHIEHIDKPVSCRTQRQTNDPLQMSFKLNT